MRGFEGLSDDEIITFDLEPEMWYWKTGIILMICLVILYSITAPLIVTYFSKTHCFFYKHIEAFESDEEQAEYDEEEEYEGRN